MYASRLDVWLSQINQQPILAQCSITLTLKNVTKPKIFWCFHPVDTRRHFNVYKTSIRRLVSTGLYASTSQFQGEFETFTGNFELTLDKISETNLFLVIELRDFNTKQSQKMIKKNNWRFQNSKSYLSVWTTNQPTHILNNFSSCIDWLITS